ncbi:nSTAND3 domain-containing NTPase [Spirochaeta dissipatitropha]
MIKAKEKVIYFITGASGVGKTTLVANLKNQYSEKAWDFFHFDSIGVPSLEEMEEKYGSGSEWQKAMTF